MLAFLPEGKIVGSLGRALAGGAHPRRIGWFKSVSPVSPKRKRTPNGVRFFVISVHFRYHFSAVKTIS